MSKLTVRISRSGDNITIKGLCLKSDLWEDWKFFLSAAKRDLLNDNIRGGNRNLRAALLCLFGHIEGSLNDFIYKSSIPNSKLKETFINKCEILTEKASIELPDTKDLKKIRNIVVHPGGKKNDSVVFDKLSLSYLDGFGGRISGWLDAISASLNIPRFTDTKNFVSVSDNLGKKIDGRKI